MSLLTIKIEKIGLKDAGQCIDPYMTVSVKGSHTDVDISGDACQLSLTFLVGLRRFERCGYKPSAGHPCGHQEGRYLHSLQCGRGDPETRGETTQR